MILMFVSFMSQDPATREKSWETVKTGIKSEACKAISMI